MEFGLMRLLEKTLDDQTTLVEILFKKSLTQSGSSEKLTPHTDKTQ